MRIGKDEINFCEYRKFHNRMAPTSIEKQRRGKSDIKSYCYVARARAVFHYASEEFERNFGYARLNCTAFIEYEVILLPVGEAPIFFRETLSF